MGVETHEVTQILHAIDLGEHALSIYWTSTRHSNGFALGKRKCCGRFLRGDLKAARKTSACETDSANETQSPGTIAAAVPVIPGLSRAEVAQINGWDGSRVRSAFLVFS